MNYMDFTGFPLSDRLYGGSEKKVGILIYGEPYMLKFQKDSLFGKRNNHLSEYLGSHIFDLLGLNVQQTLLGTYEGKQVVACKDFVSQGCVFVPFNGVGESSIEANREEYQYSYSDILKLLESNRKLTEVKETIQSFFDIYIVDALLGNFDRHGSNWGFLKRNNKYEMAPVFDNGSCLFPQMTEEDMMENVLADPEEINQRVYTFPTSQIHLNGIKSSYYDVISSLKFEECNNALKRIVPRVNLGQINNLVDQLPISEIHRRFYKIILKERYEKILKYSFDLLMEKNYGK